MKDGAAPDTASPQGVEMPQTPPKWSHDEKWWEGNDFTAIGDVFDPRRLDTPPDRRERSSGGRRSRTLTTRKRGHYVRARPTPHDASDLAFDATLRTAAPYQKERQAAEPSGPALQLRPEDYQKKVRIRRAANLILFVVDASWSMAVSERMEATKGAIFSLLTDAYQRRDRVGMIVFRSSQAVLALPPTNSVELAQNLLTNLPVGGKTPLSAGLWLAHRTVKRELLRYPELDPLLIILTDGAGNVSMGDRPPQLEAYTIAEQIRESNFRSVVVNMENARFDTGLANTLAEHLGAWCYNLSALKAESLLRMVRGELE